MGQRIGGCEPNGRPEVSDCFRRLCLLEKKHPQIEVGL